MNEALKFPGRTRQKKHLFSFLIIFILFGPLFPFSGVQASEAENIDSMDVHPTNRWEITDVGFTSSISSGLLNSSDTGDGTNDFYRIARDLRDLDGTIEMRFLLIGGGGDGNDYFRVRLYNADSTGEYNRFLVKLDGVGNQVVRLDMESEDGYKSKDLGVVEGITLGVWYRLRFDYDILRSTFRYRMYFDNGTKVFDYHIIDVSLSRPKLFSATSLGFWINTGIKSNSIYTESLVDFVKAPFKEREWSNERTSGDSDWLGSSAVSNSIQDDIDDYEYWQLTVPYLDVVSGQMFIMTDPIFDSNDGTNEIFHQFAIYNTEYDDGNLHQVISIKLIIQSHADGGALGYIYVAEALGTPYLHATTIPVLDAERIDVKFDIGILQDRSKLSWQIEGWFNGDTANSFTATGAVDIATEVVNESPEFVLEAYYSMDFDYDVRVYSGYHGISILERGIWSDFYQGMAEIIVGEAHTIADNPDPFTALFRWLGSFIEDAFDLVIGGLTLALEAALGLVEGAISALEPFLTGITDAVGALVEFIQAIGEDVIDYLITIIGDVLEAIFDGLALLVDAVADLIFVFWNAIGLPDILTFGSELLAYIVELIDWTLVTFLDVIQLAADLAWLILVLWWLWAVPIQWARANFDPLGGLGNFIEVYFYDALPWSIFGFHLYVPQGIVFTLWLIVLLPADFAIFGAMGL